MWSKIVATVCLLILLIDNRRSFVDTAPLDSHSAAKEEILNSWKINNRNNKLACFDEEKEKNWNGPYYFVQGADIQFGLIEREIEKKPKPGWEKEKVLAEAIVKKINDMRPRPRFFVICGDLCDAFPVVEQETRDEQELDFKRIFGKVDKEIPLVCVCGNHDVGNTPTHESVKKYRNSFGDDYFSFFCGGILYIVINSQYFYDSSKVEDIAEEHVKWINRTLEEAKKGGIKRIVVFQHIPWFLESIDEKEVPYFTLGSGIRKKWLDKFKEAGVEAIFCGHLHRNAGGEYRNMKVVTTSAIGGQLGNDKSGARIVRIFENGIEHKYYAIEDLPVKNGQETKKDEEVKELESLKKVWANVPPVGKHISVGKTTSAVYSNVNGHKTSHGEIKEQVNKDGKVFAKLEEKVDVTQDKNSEPKAKSKIEIEVPSENIYKTFTKEGENLEVIDGQDFSNNGQRRSENSENGIAKLNALAGLEYTPLDMAEYIFWTGDEKGVVMAIEEFLEEGLMSRDEAINFLQSIKTNFDYMQEHYHGLQKAENRIPNNMFQGRGSIRERLSDSDKGQSFDYDNAPESERMRSYSYDDSMDREESARASPYERQGKYQGEGYDAPLKLKGLAVRDSSNARKKRFKDEGKAGNALAEENFEEMLERLRVADFLYNEYSLEEVIYQLAKVVFSQSLARDNRDAQLALQKFISFLEKESKLGQISKSLEKKILDLLIAALSDTLSEHPQLLSAVKENVNKMDLSNLSSASKNLKMKGGNTNGSRTAGKPTVKTLSEQALTSKN